jgi:thermitase
VQRGGQVVQSRPFKTTRAPDGRQAVADRIIVAFAPNATVDEIAAAHALAQTQGIKTAAALRTIGPTTQLVDVTGGASLSQALAVYTANPHVRYAVPDYVYHVDEVPSDPLFGLQWGMTQIQAPAAWNVTHGAPTRLVAIVDTGIYDEASTFPSPDAGPGHPDLRGKVVTNVNFTAEANTDDNNGHGTHVAGIAAANTNNGIGVAGVGYLTRLLNVKVADATGSAPSSAVESGIRWAADNGAHVINLSLGGPGACAAPDQDAIDYAWARNVVIVVAAGNDGTSNLVTPASCNHVISVASTDSNDTKSSFSTFGSWVQVAAPGGMDGTGHGILSTDFTGNYVYKQGTSMSTPHVSGLAALVWSTSFGTSNQAVVDRIYATADPIGGTGTFWARGRINASAAVSQPVCSPRPAVSVSTTPSGTNRLQVTVSVSGTSVFLQSIQFGNPASNPSAPSNALIDIGSQVGQRGSFTFSAPAGSRSTTFFVRRDTPGAATTVPLVVSDSCGAWPTLVGGGPSAF